MNKRTLNWIIVLLVLMAIGITTLMVYQQVTTATGNIEAVLTDTMLTRTAIAGD